jgi:hypothetical protein
MENGAPVTASSLVTTPGSITFMGQQFFYNMYIVQKAYQTAKNMQLNPNYNWIIKEFPIPFLSV